jgi:hypothetical protein
MCLTIKNKNPASSGSEKKRRRRRNRKRERETRTLKKCSRAATKKLAVVFAATQRSEAEQINANKLIRHKCVP